MNLLSFCSFRFSPPMCDHVVASSAESVDEAIFLVIAAMSRIGFLTWCGRAIQ